MRVLSTLVAESLLFDGAAPSLFFTQWNMSHGIFDGCIDRLRGDIRFLLPYLHTMDTDTGEYRSSVHLMRLSLSESENGVVNLVDLIFRVNNPENTRAKHAGNYAECRFFSSACGLTAAGCWISLPRLRNSSASVLLHFTVAKYIKTNISRGDSLLR